jgi:hypothetical protein
MFAANVSQAFEIDGLKSGISMDQAKKILATYSYKNIGIEDTSITASDNERRIVLSFCKGKLVQANKHLKQRLDYFVRLVDEKRRELGKPVDAWSAPTDVTSTLVSNSVSFFWKDGPAFLIVRYIQFDTNNQLDMTYSISNSCFKTP